MFDVLKEDFDYWFIVGTFGACNNNLFPRDWRQSKCCGKHGIVIALFM